MKRVVRASRLLGLACLASLACGESASGADPILGLRIVAGDGQVGPAGQELDSDLVVQVTTVDGEAVSGAEVTWTVLVGLGAMAERSTTTDAQGNANNRWLAGFAAEQRVRAEIAAGVSVEFTATGQSLCSAPFPLEPGPPNGDPLYVYEPLAGFRDVPGGKFVAFDVGADGDDDILMFYRTSIELLVSGEVELLENDRGAPLLPRVLDIGVPPQHLSAFRFEPLDLGGDGIPELFVAQGGYDNPPNPGAVNLLLAQDGAGGLRDEAPNRFDPYLTGFTYHPAVGDIDCDGDDDLFEGALDQGQLRVQGSDQVLRIENWRLPSVGADTAVYGGTAFCDVDADGDLDLFLVAEQSDSRIAINDGFGRFEETVSDLPVPHGNGVDWLRCRDLDLDGYPDAVIGVVDAAVLEIWHNNGDLSFSDVTGDVIPPTQGGGLLDLFVEDLNGDGWDDILINSNSEDSLCRLHINNGDGTFRVRQTDAIPDPAGVAGAACGAPYPWRRVAGAPMPDLFVAQRGVLHNIGVCETQADLRASTTFGNDVAEGAQLAVYVSLVAPIDAQVDVSVTSSDPTEALVNGQASAAIAVSPTPADQCAPPQVLLVSGVDDGVVDGPQSVTLSIAATSSSPAWNGLTATVDLVVTDID